MSLLLKLQDEMKLAMRQREARRLSAIRMLISAIRYAQIDNPEMSEEQVLAVLKKEAKKRRESILAYEQAGRQEAASEEQFELELIESYLPAQMSEEELTKKVEQVLKDGQYANFGLAMNAVMKAVGSEADGGMVAKIVKAIWHQ